MSINPNDPALSIRLPQEFFDQCGFGDADELTLHAAEGALILTKNHMTALDAANAVQALSELTATLFTALSDACGKCRDCGQCDECEPSEHCRIQLPASILAEAGILESARLEAFADEETGRVIVEPSYAAHDLSDVPDGVKQALCTAGVCLAELEDLVMQDEIVYGE